MEKNKQENGQVLVLIILAAVVIFGFAALAVDVGRLYSERRRAQSAADAAAYAAAFAASQGDAKTTYLQKGLSSADTNGFKDTDVDANIDQPLDVQVYNPPISGKYSVASDTIKPDQYYQVIIRTEVPKVFSQFVYSGPWIVQVESVVRSTSKTAFAGGNAIVATCEHCCDAITFVGTGTGGKVVVVGGDIQSNSDGDGSGSCDSGTAGGNTCVAVLDGDINLVGQWNNNANACTYDLDGDGDFETISDGVYASGDVNEDTDPWSGLYPGEPGCVKPDNTSLDIKAGGTYKAEKVGGKPGPAIILSPGIYTGGIKLNDPDTVLQLMPGMYCLDDDLDITAGSVTGDGVMIVMRGDNSINISAKTQTKGGKEEAVAVPSVKLTAPGEEEQCIRDPTNDDIEPGFCWSGYLFYLPMDNEGTVNLLGGSGVSFEGTIYAPGPVKDSETNKSKKCKLGGGSDTLSVEGSIICYSVDVGGSGSVNITYKDKINAQQPALIELAK